MNFQVDSRGRKYRLWWNGEAHDALTVKLLPVYGMLGGRKNWERRAISADYHGWNELPGEIRDGLYQAVIADDDGEILRQEEIWVGPPGSVMVTIKKWERTDFYVVHITSSLPLSEKDYYLKTFKRQHIRGTKLKKKAGCCYEETYLLRIGDLSFFEVVLSEQMQARLGKPELQLIKGV